MVMNDTERKNMSRHILPTSENLLGLCFLILSLKKLWKADGVESFVDKLDGVTIIVFLIAGVLSYNMSMRSKKRLGKTKYGAMRPLLFNAK